MKSARNWYIYITCAVTLNGTIWGLIEFFRTVFLSNDFYKTSLALQLSIIIIGFPAFLLHWIWAQILVRKNKEDHLCFPRQLYFIAILAGTLAPGIYEIYHLLVEGLVRQDWQEMVYYLIAFVILVVVFTYNFMSRRADFIMVEEEESFLILNRLYLLGFSLTGLIMVVISSQVLINFLINSLLRITFGTGITNVGVELIQLLVGTTVWAVFWIQNQKWSNPLKEKPTIVLRWSYLYLVILSATLATVITITQVIDHLIQQGLGISPDGMVRDYISTIIVAGVVWYYHANILKDYDKKIIDLDSPKAVQWLYHYLISGIGFSAIAIGLTGLIHLFIKTILLRNVFNTDLKIQLAIFASIVITGIPTWWLSWRQIVARIKQDDGIKERGSAIRRYYLYLFILIATLTLLHGLIYSLYQILLRFLGEEYFRTLFSDVAIYLSNVIVAGLVLIYHWYLMRSDSQVLRKVILKERSSFKVTLLGGSFPLSNSIFDELRKDLLGYEISEFNLDVDEFEEGKFRSEISGTDVVVIPTSILEHTVFGNVIEILNNVNVFKIFIPQPDSSSHWLGAQFYEGKSLVKQIAKSIQSIFEGENIRSRGTPGCLIFGSILGVVFVVLILIVAILIISGY